MVLVAVILIVLAVNSISSSCDSSKSLTWTGKYKSRVGARVGKYKWGAKTNKYKLEARVGGQGQGWGPSKGPAAGKCRDPRVSFNSGIYHPE